MQVLTTLKAIIEAQPCDDGIRKLLKHLGKTVTKARTDEAPMPVLTVLESNGLGDAIWVLDRAVGNKHICRLFAADCAERVHHIFAAACPDDDRPMKAIQAARDPNATDEQLEAAREAAWDAARAAARAAAGDAARAAAGAAARAAAGEAAWAAAGAAAGEATGEAARAAQKRRLAQYLTHGEAASKMPWPDAAEAA